MDPEPQQREYVEEECPGKTTTINRQSEPCQSPTKDQTGDTPKMAHDSLVTVRLSEPPSLTIDTSLASAKDTTAIATRRRTSTLVAGEAASLETPDATDSPNVDTATPVNPPGRGSDSEPASEPLTPLPAADVPKNIQEELENSEEREEQVLESEDEDEDTRDSSRPDEVDWVQLEKSEAEEPKDDDTDKSTAMLLAMLEQENAKLATNPKSVKVKVDGQRGSQMQKTKRPRPPSMAQLRDMINGPTPPALRYSMLPPPPMTDLEFYLALVRDYHQTAARLPTLLSNKIRKGIPPPLRGVVWQSMSGARDSNLEDQYDKFSGESSPYEPLIGKDLGRSFPGVDMFRDPEGDGQRMLGRVLKSFSLYDQKIGYCQGLAFLVGPLLMHMPDKQAFCVLVRLMERYDLRSSFLPDLSGLHVRIHQFKELLRENIPELSRHMEELQVDPGYVSQWFLSFFAVTCPLPMLFRIYDVIFAEGAPETLMRVALSLMRKNQDRILSCTEFEDVMQLLLSRGLWDCYHYNADEFVQDFTSLTGVVSREKLQQLELGYREAQIAPANAGRTSDVATAASRFLGRIWAVSSPKPSMLSPGLTAPSRPVSMLRRSASKQSLASTLNSMEASSASVASSASTEVTAVSRDSANIADDNASIKTSNAGNQKNTEERQLHSQIEDLLTALTELQRNHSVLVSELQREREEREEDRLAVRSLLDGLRKKTSNDSVGTVASSETVKPAEPNDNETNENSGDIDLDQSEQGGKPSVDLHDAEADDGKSEDSKEPGEEASTENSAESLSAEGLLELLDTVEHRFQAPADKNRRSSAIQTKPQLRQDLEHAKAQLATSMSQCQEYTRRISDLDQEVSNLKDQLKDSHNRTRNMHQDKQRLEKQIHNMRSRASAADMDNRSLAANDDDWHKGTNPTASGLRELKLVRSNSSPSAGMAAHEFGRRSSSLQRSAETTGLGLVAAASKPTIEGASSEQESLLLELVQAKTAEAMARQEADETKQKLENLRKAYGLAPTDTPPATNVTTTAATAAKNVFGRFAGVAGAEAPKAAPAPPASTGPVTSAKDNQQTSNGGVGALWGWRR